MLTDPREILRSYENSKNPPQILNLIPFIWKRIFFNRIKWGIEKNWYSQNLQVLGFYLFLIKRLNEGKHQFDKTHNKMDENLIVLVIIKHSITPLIKILILQLTAIAIQNLNCKLFAVLIINLSPYKTIHYTVFNKTSLKNRIKSYMLAFYFVYYTKHM